MRGASEDNMADVLIVVPSQGFSADRFLGVARKVREQMDRRAGPDYRHATIVRTVVNANVESVTLERVGGGKFAMDGQQHFKRVILICHSGHDGPNLAIGDDAIAVHQPLGKTDGSGDLNNEGKRFWGGIRESMSPEGKIVLLGCNMGSPRLSHHSYAASVGRFTQRSVFAATTELALANGVKGSKQIRALAILQAIDGGKRFPHIKSFGR
jgi:hypothetical protein